MRSLALMLVCAGCGLGDGNGALSGTLYVRSCTSDSDFGTSPAAPRGYDMAPHFFVASPIDDFERLHPMNRLSIRMQPAGNRVEESDSLNLLIANDFDVASHMNQDIVVGAATNVRGTLNLNVTCPKAEVQMTLEGTINWTQFGSAGSGPVSNDFKIDFEDRLAASFAFSVVDLRAASLGQIPAGSVSPDAAVAGNLTGNFDFIVRKGRAAQSP